MSSSTRECFICRKNVEVKHYSRHLNSHSAEFQCIHCPSVSFTRKDNYIRHMKRHGLRNTYNEYEPSSNSKTADLEPFVIKTEQLKQNAAKFTIDLPNFGNQEDTPFFIHPFTCKIIGPRGSGKTCFTISYIQKIACLMFPKIFIVTASHEQPLYDLLKDNSQVYFISLTELEATIKSHRDILIILDDVMQEARYNNTLETIFTRGRHQRISVMSLEQDLFYSNPVERRNADYYVLMRMRDTSCLIQFYKRFCSDVQQWRFVDIYEYSVANKLGYLIIDFVSHKYKYRLNSLNLYYDTDSIKMKCIDSSFKSTGRKQANAQLQQRFLSTISEFKSGKRQCETIDQTIHPKVNFCRDIPTLQNKLNKENQGHAATLKTAQRNICEICKEDYYNPEALAMHYSLDHKTEK